MTFLVGSERHIQEHFLGFLGMRREGAGQAAQSGEPATRARAEFGSQHHRQPAVVAHTGHTSVVDQTCQMVDM